MNTELDPQEQQDARAETLRLFTEKKSNYPSMWADAYKACREDEDFVLGGNQLSPQQARNYGFGQNYRMPNMLKPYINNQANQTLQNDYRAVVTPNGGGSDVTKARLREQALRGIQRVGGAPEVYNLARRGQLAGGIHYSKVVVDYADYRGMEQEYCFEDVQDTYSVFPDPYVQKATFEDMNDFLIKEDVPAGKWEEKTGTKWRFDREKSHTIWFYWRKVKALSDKEYIGEDGQGILESELPMGADGSPDLTLVKRGEDGSPYFRDVVKWEWEWNVIDDQADQIYSTGRWLGACAPLVACTGEKVIRRDGNGVKIYYRSLAHDAKEPQMVYTICENLILLQLAKSPYPHYEIAAGSINIKQLTEYRQSAIIGDNDLIYNAVDENGNPLPKPNKVGADGVDPELVQLQQVQLQKIERILGIYDAALGQRTNEKSGVAIKERAKQSNLANYHFEFNFQEYVRQLGYVVLESMPHYLSAKQVIPMLDDDDQMVMQEINGGPNSLSFGPDERYRMVVEVVPDSDTNREAEAEMLMSMADSPILGPVIMQVPGAAAEVVKAQKGKYAQRIGKMMEDAKNDPEKARMAQEMDAMRQQGQRLQAENEALKKSKDLEVVKEQNRHAEKMAEIEVSMAQGADKTEIDAFRAETDRQKVTGIPAAPASILTPGGEIETDETQAVENVMGELHPGEVHRGLGVLEQGA